MIETLKTIAYLGVLAAAVYFSWKAGVKAARREARKNSQPPLNLNADYMRGLNFMLTEQPDKALDVFLQMVEVDHETVETHFALGSLYRKRGEIDRAIRVHQNLIARPNLNKVEKQNALFNLAEDYLSAGLLDRAEALYAQIEKPGDHYDLAQKRILSLDEQQKDWEKAIKVAEAQSKDKQDVQRLAHYYCELAELALHKNDLHQAKLHLKGALKYAKDFLRAKIIATRIAAKEGKPEQVVKQMALIMEHDINLVAEIMPSFFRLAQEENNTQMFDEQLLKILDAHPQYVDVLVSSLVRHDLVQTPGTRKIVLEYIRQGQQFNALHTLLPDDLRSTPEDLPDERFNAILGVLKLTGHGKAAFQCVSCGYASSHHQWNCPGCKSWDTAKATAQYR
ncbi:MAG: hypothetical protein HKN88_08245 [Gammaproteobacteria bacterium]|nr:hypothetical protein [Gammaproteobacteria bacterium]NNM14600.1 hypothetical protein [Gammaproteobacteria bacterium]